MPKNTSKNMSKKKKGNNPLQQNHSGRNDKPNYTTEKPSTALNNAPPAKQDSATTQSQQPPAAGNSETLSLSAVTTLSKQVTALRDDLKQVALREDVKQLIDATLNQGKNISNNLSAKLDTTTSDFTLRLNNVDRKIDNVAKIIRSDVQSLSGLEQIIADKSGNVADIVKNFSKVQRNSNAALVQQLGDVEGRLKDIGEQTELIQSLPRRIDDLTEILSTKGLQIKQELPALNHDEETLAQLAQFGEKILQQLAIAARWYARVLPELSKHEIAIKNLNETHEKELARAAKDGEARGRKAVVRDLLARYGENIHDLMTPAEDADGRLKVLATFLNNEGVNPIYNLHEELEITDDNLMNYEHSISNLRAGKIVITSPGYVFDTEVISKASYMTADEFEAVSNVTSSEEISAATNVTQTEENSAATNVTPSEENSAATNVTQTEENSAAINVTPNEENSAATNEVTPTEENSAASNVTQTEEISAKG